VLVRLPLIFVPLPVPVVPPTVPEREGAVQVYVVDDGIVPLTGVTAKETPLQVVNAKSFTTTEGNTVTKTENCAAVQLPVTLGVTK
jgi:hypothetical protein